MIQIEKTEIFGWEAAIRGMRNPMNSWDKSDSLFWPGHMQIGEKDIDLMKRLVKSGTDHSKFMRFIIVTCDITAPLYWWKEYETYKVGTVSNSCSTMHKISEKKFTSDDFSHEHICIRQSADVLRETVCALNTFRNVYLNGGPLRCESGELRIYEKKDGEVWWQMIQLLPSSYNQKRTVLLNYAVLRNMYHARKNHKLDEWREFCKWIETLPQSELITMEV